MAEDIGRTTGTLVLLEGWEHSPCGDTGGCKALNCRPALSSKSFWIACFTTDTNHNDQNENEAPLGGTWLRWATHEAPMMIISGAEGYWNKEAQEE